MKVASRLEGILKDPLSEVSRKERRALLGISLLSIMVVNIGLIPTKISALGIDLKPEDQYAFRIILALVLVYYIIAFTLYGLSDFFAWRIAFNTSFPTPPKEEDIKMYQSIIDNNNDGEEVSERSWFGSLPSRYAHFLSKFRIFFEVFLPVLIGVCALFATLFGK
ncbi:hypothetical protein [Desulfobulbus propionicus]|jgi:hypothetical protein